MEFSCTSIFLNHEKKLIIFIYCFLPAILHARLDSNRINHVKFYVNDFAYPEFNTKSQIKEGLINIPGNYFASWSQIGLSYQRSVLKSWDVSFGYYQWNTTNILNALPDHFRMIRFNNSLTRLGLKFRENLQFFDASVIYNPLNKKKHKIAIGVALSFQKGYSGINDSISTYGSGPSGHYIIFGHKEYKEYWGYVPSISYDFVFLKGWASIGADIRARRYFNYDYTQIDFGFHIGVNFGDPHFHKPNPKTSSSTTN